MRGPKANDNFWKNIPKNPEAFLRSGVNPSYRPKGETKYPIVLYIESTVEQKWEYANLLLENKGICQGDQRAYNPSSEELQQILIALASQQNVHPSWIKWALEHKNSVPNEGILGQAMLAAARHKNYPFILLFLKKFPNKLFLNSKDPIEKKCALHYCVAHGNLKFVRTLLEHGAYPGDGENSPLAYAFQLGQEEIILAMLRHPKYEAKIEDFEKSACEYLKASAKFPSPLFQKILLSLTVQVRDRQIGLVLMLFIAQRERSFFEKENPDFVILADAYLKIFRTNNARENDNTSSCVEKLQRSELITSKILFEIFPQLIGNGLSKKTDLLVLENWKKQADSGDADAALLVAEASCSGFYGRERNFGTTSTYFKIALKSPEKFSNCLVFLREYQKHHEVLEPFIQFAQDQNGECRQECEFVISQFDHSEALYPMIKVFLAAQIFYLKNPAQSSREKLFLLGPVFRDASWQLKISIYIIYLSWLEDSSKILDFQVKYFFDSLFEKNEMILVFLKGLSSELHHEESIKILLHINTDFARTILIDHFTFKYRSQSREALEKKLAQRDFLNRCEIAAINKYLVLMLFQDQGIDPKKKQEILREYLFNAMQDPEAKEFYAEKLRDGFFKEKEDAGTYFFQAACQFFELYRYVKPEHWLLHRAMTNLAEALKLKNVSAAKKFEELLRDEELNGSEREIVNSHFQTTQLKEEDFHVIEVSPVRKAPARSSSALFDLERKKEEEPSSSRNLALNFL